MKRQVFGFLFKDFFYGLRMTQTQGYQMDHSLLQRLFSISISMAHEILETAQSPNSSFPFLFDFGL